jgi:Zn-dependent protease
MSFAAAIPTDAFKTVGIYLVCLVLSIAVHEYFHALFAQKLGDPTPESEGRVTLNPLVHADPIGTLAMPVIAAFTALPLLGWGKPVPTQPRHYSRKVTMRSGMAIVAVAGPLGNLVLAAIVVLIGIVLRLAGILHAQIEQLLLIMLQLNVLLMAFNLLPLHPLDGGKILAAFLPPKWEHIDEFLMRYGGWIIIGLVVAGGRFLGILIAPFMSAANWVWQLSVG